MTEPHPPVDWFEFWVRFVCGALLGIAVGFRALSSISTASWDLWLALGGCGVPFGLLAGWFGDRFWLVVASLLPWW